MTENNRLFVWVNYVYRKQNAMPTSCRSEGLVDSSAQVHPTEVINSILFYFLLGDRFYDNEARG